MRYERDDLQDLLAAEFALGSLRGGARRRLVALMRRHPALRARVLDWEERLYPLALRAPKVKAPRGVWRRIHARIAPHPRATAWLAGWRRFAFAAATIAALALVYVAVVPPRAPDVTVVAVLNDPQGAPGIAVGWSAHDRARLKVRIVAHPQMPPDTSWQAWLLRGPNEPPLALGLIGIEETQVLELPRDSASALPAARAIAVSVEPKGGSVTGQPTLPYVFEGRLLRLDG